MNEDFLHFIWKFRLFDAALLETSDGQRIEVLSVGLPNWQAGPDFLNAQIKIGDTVWVGNVEIHVKSSLWETHNHHTDGAYNNVVLHVVGEIDRDVFTANKCKIPCCKLLFNPSLYNNYLQLNSSNSDIVCHSAISDIDLFRLHHFLNRVLVERLERKTNDIEQILQNTQNDWLSVFYQLLFRAFGFGANTLPFQLLAQSIPVKVLAKYSVNLQQTEALLFGQAGFLVEYDGVDEYYKMLQTEYNYMQTIHKLRPLDKSIWKFGGLRPSNFPTIRIAQLAGLLAGRKNLLDDTLAFNSVNDLHKLFNCVPSDYWGEHYTFGKLTKKQSKPMGTPSVDKLIINMVVPFVFSYAQAYNKPLLQDKALGLLDNLPAESNSTIDKWKAAGVKIQNAFHSQAYLQLKQNYCDQKRCLNCQIGKLIIQKSINN